MDELLPHYEVELRRLAADAARFAVQHPALAQRLGITGEGLSEDPQVERLMQAAALLNARASLHIENGQARLTEGLLQRLAPQYLRPFPACAIASFEPDAATLAAGETLTLPRGTTLRSAPLRGVRCAFRTAYTLTLPPLRVGPGSGCAAGRQRHRARRCRPAPPRCCRCGWRSSPGKPPGPRTRSLPCGCTCGAMPRRWPRCARHCAARRWAR